MGLGDPTAAAGPRTREIRTFVLEDDPLAGELLLALLGAAGIRDVTLAASLAGARAHEADLARGAFALAILDVHLPDGVSLPWARDVLAQAPTPVILCTTRLSARERQDYRSMGFSRFLPKPLTPERVRAGLAGIPGLGG